MWVLHTLKWKFSLTNSLFQSEQCAISYKEIGELMSLYVHGCYVYSVADFFQGEKFS